MSQRDRDQLAVSRQVRDGLITAARGADLVGLSPRVPAPTSSLRGGGGWRSPPGAAGSALEPGGSVGVLPIVGGGVATAELLAVVARLDVPIERNPGDAVRRVGLAAVIGGGVFGVVALAGGLPGPTGLVAIAVSARACIVLARLLVRVGQAARGPGVR